MTTATGGKWPTAAVRDDDRDNRNRRQSGYSCREQLVGTAVNATGGAAGTSRHGTMTVSRNRRRGGTNAHGAINNAAGTMTARFVAVRETIMGLAGYAPTRCRAFLPTTRSGRLRESSVLGSVRMGKAPSWALIADGCRRFK